MYVTLGNKIEEGRTLNLSINGLFHFISQRHFQSSVPCSNLLKHSHTSTHKLHCHLLPLVFLDKWTTFHVKTLAQLQCCFRFSLERFMSATWARVAVFIQAWLHGDQLLCHYTAWKITVLCHTSSLLCRIISFIIGKQARGAWRLSMWRCVLWKRACVPAPTPRLIITDKCRYYKEENNAWG